MNIPDDMTTVVRKRCGCLSILAVTNYITAETIREIGRYVAAGGTVEQIPAEEARNLAMGLLSCPHGAVEQPAPPLLPFKWKCMRCHGIYDNEDEANECCPVKVRQVVYCPLCDEEYTSAEEAIACCDWEHDSAPQRPSAGELEAAGQLRLPIDKEVP